MTTGHAVENVSWVSCLNSLTAKRLHKKWGKRETERKARYMMNDKDLTRNHDVLRPKLVMKINK